MYPIFFIFFNIIFNVFPLSTLSNPLTFSWIIYLQLVNLAILIVSKNNLPLGSSSPFYRPATDIDWQGDPAQHIVISSLITFLFIF